MSTEKMFTEINDRLRSLYQTEEELKKHNKIKKKEGLRIGKVALELKNSLKKEGKMPKEINQLFKEKFKKDRRRIDEFIAAYKVIKKNSKLQDADLSVLIILGQALGSDCEIRRKRASKAIKENRITIPNSSKRKKVKVSEANRREVIRSLSSLKNCPEYNLYHRIRKLSYITQSIAESLNNEIVENGIDLKLKDSFRSVLSDSEDRLNKAKNILSDIRTRKDNNYIKRKQLPKDVEYLTVEEINANRLSNKKHHYIDDMSYDDINEVL